MTNWAGEEQIEALTRLVEKIEGPCVLAVDGGHGDPEKQFSNRCGRGCCKKRGFHVVEFNVWGLPAGTLAERAFRGASYMGRGRRRLLQDFDKHYTTTGRDLHAKGRSTALWRSLCNEMVVSFTDYGNRTPLVDQKSRYLARQQLAAYKKLIETGEPQTLATAEISPRGKW